MASLLDREGVGKNLRDEELFEAVRGRSTKITPVDALKEISRRGPAGKSELLASVVTGRENPLELRAVAAVALGREGLPQHQSALLAALDTGHPSVLRRVVESLGRIGDRQALDGLDALKPPPAGPVSAAVEFAKSLISYRLSLGTHRLKAPAASEILEIDPARALPVKSDPADPELLRKLRPRIQRQLPGIPVSTSRAFQLECRGNRFLLLLHGDLESAKDLNSFAARDSVPLTILKHYSSGTYSVAEYLLAHPGEPGKLLLFGVRPSGARAHYGEVRVEAERATFRVRGLSSALSPPIDIEGEYWHADRRIAFARALVGVGLLPTQAQPRRPQPG